MEMDEWTYMTGHRRMYIDDGQSPMLLVSTMVQNLYNKSKAPMMLKFHEYI